MIRARQIRNALQDLARTVGFLAVVAASCLLINVFMQDHQADHPAKTVATIMPSPVSDAAEIAMSVPADRLSSHYSMRDEKGREVVLITHDRTGAVGILLGNAFPARAACWATPNGCCALSVTHAGHHYKLVIKPDGSSDYAAYDSSYNLRDRLSLAPGGRRPQEP